MTPTDVTPPEDHEDDQRYVVVQLSDAQIEIIAKRVEDRFYSRVGRKVVEKVLWMVGVGVAVLLAWAAGTGKLPK